MGSLKSSVTICFFCLSMGAAAFHASPCCGRSRAEPTSANANKDLEARLASRPSYVFDLADQERWLEQLHGHGFVVLRGVASADDVDAAKGLLWDAVSERHQNGLRDD